MYIYPTKHSIYIILINSPSNPDEEKKHHVSWFPNGLPMHHIVQGSPARFPFNAHTCDAHKTGSVKKIELPPIITPGVKSTYPLVSSNMASCKITALNGGFTRKITDEYGPFSSTPCLITGGYLE